MSRFYQDMYPSQILEFFLTIFTYSFTITINKYLVKHLIDIYEIVKIPRDSNLSSQNEMDTAHKCVHQNVNVDNDEINLYSVKWRVVVECL
jgi:hypothetical protein